MRIENHGPEEQTLTWAAVPSKGESTSILVCENNKVLLKPGEYCNFKFTARSKKPLCREEQWLLRSNVAGKSTDVAFTVSFQYRFVHSQVAIYDVVDGEEREIELSKHCQPLELVYEEFPVFGNLYDFFGDGADGKMGNCMETQDGECTYINSRITHTIKIQNLTMLNCRLQVIVRHPFYIKLVDESGNEAASPLDTEEEIQEIDFRASQLDQEDGPRVARPAAAGKSFESFILTNEAKHQYLQVGIDRGFCVKDRICKTVEGNVVIRLLPLEQNP